jgi:hypothetical protein
VAPQAGPKIRALGAPLGHCERRPSATGPFQWPKKDRLRQQRTGACCCAVARGPRPGGPALLCRTRQPGTARRSPRFSCKALFGPLLGLSGRAARRVVARFSELRGRSGEWLKARPKPFQGPRLGLPGRLATVVGLSNGKLRIWAPPAPQPPFWAREQRASVAPQAVPKISPPRTALTHRERGPAAAAPFRWTKNARLPASVAGPRTFQSGSSWR